MNCANCNKPFTCGCQKMFDINKTAIHKTCENEWATKSNINSPDVSHRDLNLELAKEQIKNLRNS
jgi:hypothetical protein